MEFGKLSDLKKLDQISWDLPTDPEFNDRVLTNPANSTEFFIGAPAWGHKEWIGDLYPAKTKAADFLFHYSRAFNAIELNTSHYRIPTSIQTAKWRTQVPNEFRFCPKVLQEISHSATGLQDKTLHAEWFRFLNDLGDHRGPCFLQLPPHFSYHAKVALFQFLRDWPREFRLAIEFRHPSWFANAQILPALQTYLQSRDIGLVITDVAGRRDVLHTSLGSDFTMIRFIGNDLHPTDFLRAQKWQERLAQWRSNGLAQAIFFVHEPDDIRMPQMARAFITGLNAKMQEQVLRPVSDPLHHAEVTPNLF